MKTLSMMFYIAVALPLPAVACPIGMVFNGNGCSPPYEYTGWDLLRDRRAAIDAIGSDRAPVNLDAYLPPNARAERARRAKEAEQERLRKLAELAKGVWGVESTSTPEGNLCAATFAKQHTTNDGVIGGMVTIMGFQHPKPDAWLMFHGAGLPKPRNVEKLKITLQQDDEPPQTVQVFNYRYGTSREMGVVAFAVPGLAAALDGMRDKQSLKLSLDGKTLMTIQWTDAAPVIKKLRQCEKA